MARIACDDAVGPVSAIKPGGGGNRAYAFLAEEVQVMPWAEFTHDTALETISRLYHDFNGLHQGIERARPLVEGYERYIPNEQSWVHLLSQTLMYHIKVALAELHVPGHGDRTIVMGTYWPFTHYPCRTSTLRTIQISTPDYTIGLGDPSKNLRGLVIGDAKLRPKNDPKGGTDNPRTPKGSKKLPNVKSMLRADLGQLLWYCSCRNTRFAFHVSNRELVLVKFARNPERSADQDIITPIKNAVDAAQTSISRAVYADPPNAPDALRRRAGEGKRHRSDGSSSSGMSTSSPSLRKRPRPPTTPEPPAVSVPRSLAIRPSPAWQSLRPDPIGERLPQSDIGHKGQGAGESDQVISKGGRDEDEDTEEVEDYSEGDEDYEPLSPEDRIQLSEAGSNVVAYVQSVPFGGEEALNCGLALLGFILTAFEQDNSPGGVAI